MVPRGPTAGTVPDSPWADAAIGLTSMAWTRWDEARPSASIARCRSSSPFSSAPNNSQRGQVQPQREDARAHQSPVGLGVGPSEPQDAERKRKSAE